MLCLVHRASPFFRLPQGERFITTAEERAERNDEYFFRRPVPVAVEFKRAEREASDDDHRGRSLSWLESPAHTLRVLRWGRGSVWAGKARVASPAPAAPPAAATDGADPGERAPVPVPVPVPVPGCPAPGTRTGEARRV